LAKLKPEIAYEPNSFVLEDSFNASNLFSRPDRYKGEDLFLGKHDKTSFSFFEIHAEKEHKSKNSKSYTTIFRGVFMVADFNKLIKTKPLSLQVEANGILSLKEIGLKILNLRIISRYTATMK
jgi:hypothetical protein